MGYVWEHGPFGPFDLHLVGADPSAPAASGLQSSDHAGVLVTPEIGQLAPGGRPMGCERHEQQCRHIPCRAFPGSGRAARRGVAASGMADTEG
jgi:hypothetical protein